MKVLASKSKRNQIIYTVTIYRIKNGLLINGPQMQKFILEVIPTNQL